MDKNKLLDTLNQLKTGKLNNTIQIDRKPVNDGIAIIGIAVRLKNAQSLEELYNVLKNRTDCISYPGDRRLKDITGYLDYKGIDPKSYALTEAAFLEEIDKFDYPYFKLSYKEARMMDPYQRIFTETVCHAFEDAGYTKERLKGTRTGVFLGQPHPTEYYKCVKELEPHMAIMAGPGNIASVIAGRISYMYDLSGPSLLVDTACSSSLAALHIACQSIRNHECEMALVGGMNILINPVHHKGEPIPDVVSSTGRARTFSDDSDGTGRGEGVMAILLKPLDMAIQDRDNIHAVIRGSAYNNDGSSLGITAPNIAAQEDVLVRAWENARISPEELGYIEAHGTGTQLGDPIEIQALSNAFAKYTNKKQFCAIGAVKTNYGHLDSAAGLLGVLKAVVSLKNKALLPSINFSSPNKKIEFISSPLYLVNEHKNWESQKNRPRICGVSAFGLSGTNCHIVLEEAPELESCSRENEALHLIPISAKTERALKEYIKSYICFIEAHPEIRLKEISYTTQARREHYNYRAAVIAGSIPDLISKLRELNNNLETDSDLRIYYGDGEVPGNTKMNILVQSIDSLEKIAEQYVLGAAISWNEISRNSSARTISLPCYHFEAKRCWLDIPLGKAVGNEAAAVNLTVNRKAEGSIMIDEKIYSREKKILEELKMFVADMFDTDSSKIDEELSFFELGIDSISIIQLSQEVKNSYGIEISGEKLFGDVNSLGLLSEYIQERLPVEKQSCSEAADADAAVNWASAEPLSCLEPSPAGNKIEAGAGSDIASIIKNQLEIMSQQLKVLQSLGANTAAAAQPNKAALVIHKEVPVKKAADGEERFLQKFIVKTPPVLNQKQKQYLDSFVDEYTKRTLESKRLTQENRHVWANGRAIQGFVKQWKEIIYPILVNRATGARIWDADGNEYIDFSMGFGVNLFGYNHSAIKEAVKGQLEEGVVLGPLTCLPAEVAKLISELTGAERVAFCNSGTEAVMNLMRIARATTGKEKIAVFSGSFHGTFDGVYMMKNASSMSEHPIPTSLGTPQKMAEDVIMLDYNEQKSIALIKKYAGELAAVLVEPVQSRKPDLQPVEFMHELRRITKELNIPLIFDEIITGFRIHPGGAQAYFGIEADMVSYGKIVGGGLPIGIFAGKAKYMDRVDGGMWKYGDQSTPSGFLAQTGGTFNHHPLAMAAAKAVLQMIKDGAGTIQEKLNEYTNKLAGYLNAFFEAAQIPLKIVHFASLFIFKTQDPTLLRFMYYKLLHKGFYLWEGATCFLSTAHSDEDIARFAQGVIACCHELKECGCYGFNINSPVPGLELVKLELFRGLKEKHTIEKSLSLISHEQDLKKAEELFAADAGIEAVYPLSTMQSLVLAQNINYKNTGLDTAMLQYKITGEIDISNFRLAWAHVLRRHSALRTSFMWRRLKEPLQIVHSSVELPFETVDFSAESPGEQAKLYKELLEAERLRSFDIVKPPLMKCILVKLAEREWRFVLKYQNSMFDGWSSAILNNEFSEFYRVLAEGKAIIDTEDFQYIDYISWLKAKDNRELREFWQEELGGLSVAEKDMLPKYKIRRDFEQGECSICFESCEIEKIKEFANKEQLTLYPIFQGAWAVLQSRMQQTDDVLVAAVTSGRPTEIEGVERIVGLFSNVLPMRIKYEGSRDYGGWLRELQRKNLKLNNHNHVSVHQIVEWSQVPEELIQDAVYTKAIVYLNFPYKPAEIEGDMIIELEEEQTHVNIPLRVYIEPFNSLKVLIRYDRYYFEEEKISGMLEEYKSIIKHICRLCL